MSKKPPDSTTRIPRDSTANSLAIPPPRSRPMARARYRATEPRGYRARCSVRAGGPAATFMQFLWPAPPYYEFVDEKARQSEEECLLTFRTRQGDGVLLDFLPDDALLKIRQTDTSTGITIGFPGLLGCTCCGRSQSGARRCRSAASAGRFSRRPTASRFRSNWRTGNPFRARPSGTSMRCAACSCFCRRRKAA